MGRRFLGIVDDVFGELSSRKILPTFGGSPPFSMLLRIVYKEAN
jgi:hypothetical protein